jgi:hypothetical protein
MKTVGLESVRKIVWRIILLGSFGDIRMEADVDIGTLPISEFKDLVRYFLFRYRKKRCRCRDIANIKAMPTYVNEGTRREKTFKENGKKIKIKRK